ncbi:MAG: NnrS family protein [Rubrivivax sp.]|nr:NnrS family protein [Rubrivivax sp.]
MKRTAGARWHAARLLDSPHRLGFAAAALVVAGSALGWLFVLQTGGGTPAALPPTAAHGLVFVFGFMPLFFTGFLFTVGPRWLGLPMEAADTAARTRALLPPVLAFAAAWLAWWPLPVLMSRLLPGASAAMVPAALLTLAAASWTLIVVRLQRLLRSPLRRDSPHLCVMALACAVGALALWAAALVVAGGAAAWAGLVAQAGLWLFCGGVFAAASHRMLPLDAMADRPALEARFPLWQLALIGGTLALQALDLAVAAAWPRPAPWSALLAAAIAATALWLALIAWRWARRQRLGRQLVAMLHAGLVWLAVALALQAAAHALAAFGGPGAGTALEQAARHALALGWMGTTMFAMVSRVAGAFGGQARAADGSAWALFTFVQVAALSRVAAALWPAAAGALTTIAAAAWLAAALGWLLVYGRWLGRAPDRPPHRGT